MINIPFRFAYLILCLPFLLVWLFLFLINKETRKEQISMSFIAMIIGPLSEIIYFRDYWIPQSIFSIFIGKFPFMIEDLLFGFAIGGIGAVIYEVIFRKRLSKYSIYTKHAIKSVSIIFVFILVLLGTFSLGVNSIYASALAFLVAGILIIYVRHDLFLNAIGSGIGVMLVMFICYYFIFNFVVANTDELLKQGWLLYNTSLGIRFSNIPITEMAWGFTWGFLSGPWYEFVIGRKNVSISK